MLIIKITINKSMAEVSKGFTRVLKNPANQSNYTHVHHRIYYVNAIELKIISFDKFIFNIQPTYYE